MLSNYNCKNNLIKKHLWLKKIITDRFKYIDVRQKLMTNQFIVTQYYLNDFIKK